MKQAPSRRSDWAPYLALGVAALAHVGLFIVVRPPHRGSVTVAEPAPIAFEMIESVEPAPEQPPVAPETPVPTLAPATVAMATKPLTKLTTTQPPPASTGSVSEPSAGPPEPPTGASSGVASKPVIPPLIDLSSPGKHSFILPSASSAKPMTKEEAVAAKLDASLKGALDAKDQVVDGGYGGPVVAAAHDAARSYQAPQVGHATFEIETDAKGLVTRVKLVDYGGDLGWERVGKELHANLTKIPLKVPTGANGVHVTVRVDAEMKLPSGAKSKKPTASAGANDYGIGVSGSFDLADIGAVPSRVVAVRLVEQHRL